MSNQSEENQRREPTRPQDICAACENHDDHRGRVKSVTTNHGMVYACELCSRHWFRKYGESHIDWRLGDD